MHKQLKTTILNKVKKKLKANPKVDEATEAREDVLLAVINSQYAYTRNQLEQGKEVRLDYLGSFQLNPKLKKEVKSTKTTKTTTDEVDPNNPLSGLLVGTKSSLLTKKK